MIKCCKCGLIRELYSPAKKMSDFKLLIDAEHWIIFGTDEHFLCPECADKILQKLETNLQKG